MAENKYKCKVCGKEHSNFGKLMQCYKQHKKEEEAQEKPEELTDLESLVQPDPKDEEDQEEPEDNNVYIPLDKLEEFKYLSKGKYVRVLCDGVITDKGLLVNNFTYYR